MKKILFVLLLIYSVTEAFAQVQSNETDVLVILQSGKWYIGTVSSDSVQVQITEPGEALFFYEFNAGGSGILSENGVESELNWTYNHVSKNLEINDSDGLSVFTITEITEQRINLSIVGDDQMIYNLTLYK